MSSMKRAWQAAWAPSGGGGGSAETCSASTAPDELRRTSQQSGTHDASPAVARMRVSLKLEIASGISQVVSAATSFASTMLPNPAPTISILYSVDRCSVLMLRIAGANEAAMPSLNVTSGLCSTCCCNGSVLSIATTLNLPLAPAGMSTMCHPMYTRPAPNEHMFRVLRPEIDSKACAGPVRVAGRATPSPHESTPEIGTCATPVVSETQRSLHATGRLDSMSSACTKSVHRAASLSASWLPPEDQRS